MNTPRNYTVVYDCLDSKGNVIKSGKIIAKRKYTEFEALAGTENYLKSKVPGMVKMVCKDLLIPTLLGDMSVWSKNKKDAFKDIFGAGNPFGL